MEETCPHLLPYLHGEAEPPPVEPLALPKPVTLAERITQAAQHAGIPDRYRSFTLVSFQRRIADLGQRSTGKDRAALAVSKRIKDGPPYDKGLLLYGDPGVGKTGLAACLANALVATGARIRWLQYNDFIKSIQEGYDDGTAEQRLAAAIRADHLFLEDLGNPTLAPGEQERQDRQEIIWRLVDERYRTTHARTLVVTTNVRLNGLADQFHPRTLERLVELCDTFQVTGANLRGL